MASRRSLVALLAASAALFPLLVLGNNGGSAAVVRVGVVVDLTSDEGRKSLSGISMMLDDFYLKHLSSTTRVELRVRDSRGDLAAAAHAAEELNNKAGAQVIIIVAPHQTLSATDSIVQLGLHHHVPVLTLFGTPPASRQPHMAPFSMHNTLAKNLNDQPYHATPEEDIVGTILTAIISWRREAAQPASTVKIARLDDSAKADIRTRARRLATIRIPSGKVEVLKIVVPRKTGFQAFVNVEDKQNITGYCIDLFKAAMSKLQSRYNYTFLVFNGSYDELVDNVSKKNFDAAVGDVTITPERAKLVEFTMPYTPSGVSMLVLSKEDDSKPIQWIFVKPLSRNLWLATIGFFFFTGFVVWMIERPTNPEYQGSRVSQLSNASYFAFSTLTFSHGNIITSPLSRIVVVVWCFVVLIIVQSYTASLSSILTSKRLQPSVTSLEELRRNGEYVGYQDGSYLGSHLISQAGFMESKLKAYKTPEEYVAALRKGSRHGGVSAIVDEFPYLTPFRSDPKYQKEFQLVDRLFYKTPGFGFVFPLGSELVHNLSIAILNITGNMEGSKIKDNWFGRAGQFTESDVDPVSIDSNPLTVQSFSGLFVISGGISILMLLICIVKRLVDATCAKVAGADVQGGGVSNISQESRPLQNVMDNNSASDQAI